MCNIYKHHRKKSRLKAAYPVFWMKTGEEIYTWMAEEPEKIVDHLKILFPKQTWEIGDRNNICAHIWDKKHNLERVYFPVNISKGEQL